MFVGRKHELDSLNKSYKRDGFQFPVIYGRRRVGKTTLINEFCKARKSVYCLYTGVKALALRRNL